MATSQNPKPDVDDDDLDDLDDVLDRFAPADAHPRPQSSTTTTFSRPRTNTRVDALPISVPGSGQGLLDATPEVDDENALSEAFSRELQKGMESLMRELGNENVPSTGESADGKNDPERELSSEEAERMFKAAWEAMLVEGMDGTSSQTAQMGNTSTSATQQGDGAPPNVFQDQIRQAMNKLRESESNLQASSNPDPLMDGSPESLEALLASFKNLGLGGGEEPNDDPELAGLLDSMMQELMTKEVLEEPLKELERAYVPYLANPPAPLSDDDRKRINSQLDCVRNILTVFSDPNFSEGNPTMKATVTNAMKELQALGTVPVEVMGPLPPGMTAGPDGMPQLGEGCVIA